MINTKSVSTGNPEMDQILMGGFPANSINIVMGQPGTGKTIFAEQLVFHHAEDDDRPVLYITTLSEPVAKVLTYLQNFSFYNDDEIGTSVHYRDIGFDLAKNGIHFLKKYLEEAIHELSPKIIVIDSFKALHDLCESAQDMRKMLHELTGMLAAFESTVFLVGEYSDEEAKALPEFAIADGIVQFLRSATSTKDERFLRVLKLRGSGYLEGLHSFRITARGIDVYPRLTSPEVPKSYEWKRERIESGIIGLDPLLGGGLLRGSSTLVAGPTGSGKTTLAAQFAIQAIQNNERSLYVNFQENPTQLSSFFKSLGLGQNDPKFELLYASPVELQIDSIIVKIFRRLQQENFSRVVIDALGDLALASSDPERLHDYLYALNQHLSVRGITSVLLFETLSNTLDGGAGLWSRFSYMSDNILFLNSPEKPDYQRSIKCVKSRRSFHELKPHAFNINEQGLTVQDMTLEDHTPC